MTQEQRKEVDHKVTYPYHTISQKAYITSVDVGIPVKDKQQHSRHFQQSYRTSSLYRQCPCNHRKNSEDTAYAAHVHHHSELISLQEFDNMPPNKIN